MSLYGKIGKYFAHKRSTSKDVEKYFKNCECGGKFIFEGRRYDIFRCPNCKELLDEDIVIALLGIDKKALESGAPFCAGVKIDGEEIDYTNPSLETIGHIKDEIWNYDSDDNDFLKALTADKAFCIKCQKEEANNEVEREIRKNIANGFLPEIIYLKAELNRFLFIKVGMGYSSISPNEIGLPIDLIEECCSWAKLGCYIEDGIGEEKDLHEEFKKTSWSDYYQAGLRLQRKLQDALGNITKIEIVIDPNGEPFFEL